MSIRSVGVFVFHSMSTMLGWPLSSTLSKRHWIEDVSGREFKLIEAGSSQSTRYIFHGGLDTLAR